MAIEIIYEATETNLKHHPEIESVVLQILKDHNRQLNWLNIIFVHDESILEINRQFLDHDYYTDIITFNYSEDKTVIEAELYISADTVEDNAEIFGVESNDELNRVIIHGTLHLSGYDDVTELLRKEMQDLENKYLALLRST